jgi:hypothetical protein
MTEAEAMGDEESATASWLESEGLAKQHQRFVMGCKAL